MIRDDDDLFGRVPSDGVEASLRRTTMASRVLTLDRHRLGMALCARRGEADLARGAQLVACVTALGLATAPTASPAHRLRKVGVLQGFVDELAPDARARMNILLAAGLDQDGEGCRLATATVPARVDATVRPHARDPELGPRVTVDGPWSPDLDRRDLARYASAAATGADVDAILARSIDVVRGMIGVPRPVDACSRLADLAYALGATAMRTRADSESSVQILKVILKTLGGWTRPAPVIRAAIALEREQWGGEAAGSA